MIKELSSLLKEKKVSVRELFEEYQKRIASSDLNAVVRKTDERAVLKAEERFQRGEETLLTGIPMALKDNLSTKGWETGCCSKMLSGYIPPYDATAWEKLMGQGAVLLGKTNMDEFAMGSTTETSTFGATKNPCDLSKVAGGSSGGSAAAVKAGLSVYALGSDTGGSIRQPAAFCGVVGLKPTYGAVSRYGLIAYASSLDTVGVLASSVEDTKIVFDAIRGKDKRDLTSIDTSIEETEVSGKTVGVIKELVASSSEVGFALEGAIGELQKKGAIIKEVSIPSIKSCLSAYYIIACAEASSNLGRYDGIRYGYRTNKADSVEEMIVKSRTEGFGAEVKKRILLGTFVLSAGYYEHYYKKACLVRNRVRAEFESALSEADVLLSPTMPETAFSLGERKGVKLYESDLNTVPMSLAGLPALSVPFGKTSLPVGMQLTGRKGAEGTLFSFGRALEGV